MKRKYVCSAVILVLLVFLAEAVYAITWDENVFKSAAVVVPEAAAGFIRTAAETTSAEKKTGESCRARIASMELDGEESYLLTKIAMAEAGGEDTEGKALVMLVVLNRVLDDKFPDTVRDVIYQKRQFSPVGDGIFDETEPDADCLAALDMIMLERWDESNGATYFESRSKSTWHSANLDFIFRHGKHYFYKERDSG